MANSKHLALRSAIAALMTAGTPLAGGNVLENRAFKLATGLASQLHVNFEGSETLALLLGLDAPQDWESTFELRILTRKSGGMEAGDCADAIWTDAYARLMADQTLGGLAWELTPGEMSIDTAEGDTSVSELTWRFTVKHRTTNNTIT